MAHSDVSTRLVVNDDAHQRALDRAMKSIRSYGDYATGAIGKVGNLYTGLGVAATVGFGAAMVKSQMDALDATGKLADRLGMTTEGLQALRHAAEQSGPGADALDAALSKLTMNLGLARQGTGEAVNAFKLLGLNADELASKDPAAVFGDIAEAVNKVPSAADKMAIVTKIFGESGGGLLNMMADGKEGLAEMAAEAEKLGLTFSRVDAAKVEAANDAIARMKSSVGGLAAQAATELSPFVAMFADDLTNGVADANAQLDQTGAKLGPIGASMAMVADTVDFVVDAFRFAQVGAMGFFEMIAEGVARTLEVAAKLPSAMGGDMFQEAAESARAFVDSVSESGFQKLKEARQGWNDPKPSERAAELAAKFAEAGAAAKRTADAASSISPATDTATKKVDDLLASWQEKLGNFGLSDRQGAINKIIADGADDEAIGKLAEIDRKLTELEQHAKDMDFGKSLTESLRTPADELEAKLEEYDRLLNEKVIDAETHDKAVNKAAADYEKGTGVTDLFERTRTNSERLTAAMAKLDEMRDAGQFEGKGDLYDRAARMYQEQYGPEKKKDGGFTSAFEGLDSLYKRIAASAAGRPPEERTAEAAEKTAQATTQMVAKLGAVETAIKNVKLVQGPATWGP